VEVDGAARRRGAGVRIAVIADTHVPRRAADLPATAWREIERADVVIHAGDVTAPQFLQRVRDRSAEVIAVRGNNDRELGALPERVEAALAGASVAVVHDAGPASGRRARLRRLFPEARVVVFGHSHIPLLDDDGDLLMLNPGSPTDRRRMPTFTMATLVARDGAIEDARIVDLGLERAPRAQAS
jgi:putative phosphoesterase